MSGYRLYQYEEINFTLQAPDSTTLANFAVKKAVANQHHYITRLDLRTPGSPKSDQIFSGPYSRGETITIAYILAKDFARELDPNFEDRTGLEGTVEETDTIEIPGSFDIQGSQVEE